MAEIFHTVTPRATKALRAGTCGDVVISASNWCLWFGERDFPSAEWSMRAG